MSTPLDRDLIILNPARNNYIGLDDIGRRVWELLAAPDGVGNLCGQIIREYAGEPQKMTVDILAFLQELADEGLVRVADHYSL